MFSYLGKDESGNAECPSGFVKRNPNDCAENDKESDGSHGIAESFLECIDNSLCRKNRYRKKYGDNKKADEGSQLQFGSKIDYCKYAYPDNKCSE